MDEFQDKRVWWENDEENLPYNLTQILQRMLFPNTPFWFRILQ